MLGGAGDDIYVVNVATDVVTELANEGVDTVRSSVTLTLAANVAAREVRIHGPTRAAALAPPANVRNVRRFMTGTVPDPDRAADSPALIPTLR